MTYKYYTAGLSLHGTPKEDLIGDFSEYLSEHFYESSDWFQIQEETALASGIYQNTDVRVEHLIDTKTGVNISDDYKRILFPDLTHNTSLGLMYQFDNNYWITTNIDKIKSLTTAVTVRRCNNVLRWMDENGGYYEFPCVLGYGIKQNRDYATAGSALVTLSGRLECITQYNSKTNKIKSNQRFLFGNENNWTAYRVQGGGIDNFDNRQTLVNTSAGLIILTLEANYDNESGDDLVNGIAGANRLSYTIVLNQSNISGSASGTFQLQATVKLGSTIVDRNVVWSSSKPAVATIDSSGLVSLIANGTATITCSLENNDSVNDTCSVVVSSTPIDTYQIVYIPESNYLLEGNTETWAFHLYKNGIVQADGFTFTLNAGTVPSENYTYLVVDSNSFVISNLEMYLEDNLTITATADSGSSMELEIFLRGAW